LTAQQTWSADGSGHALMTGTSDTSQHRWQGNCYSCALSLTRGYRFQYITTVPNNARNYRWGN